MSCIENFFCTQRDENVQWNYDGKKILKKFNSKVVAECFTSKDAVLVIVFSKEFMPDNAFIYNPDGSEKARVKNPESTKGGASFSDAYYVGDELTLFIRKNIASYGCVIDESGQVIRAYETR